MVWYVVATNSQKKIQKMAEEIPKLNAIVIFFFVTLLPRPVAVYAFCKFFFISITDQLLRTSNDYRNSKFKVFVEKSGKLTIRFVYEE